MAVIFPTTCQKRVRGRRRVGKKKKAQKAENNQGILCLFDLEVDDRPVDRKKTAGRRKGTTYRRLHFCCRLPALPRVGDQVWFGKNPEDSLDDPHTVERVSFYTYYDFVLIDLEVVNIDHEGKDWTLDSYCEMLIEAGFKDGDAFLFDDASPPS